MLFPFQPPPAHLPPATTVTPASIPSRKKAVELPEFAEHVLVADTMTKFAQERTDRQGAALDRLVAVLELFAPLAAGAYTSVPAPAPAPAPVPAPASSATTGTRSGPRGVESLLAAPVLHAVCRSPSMRRQSRHGIQAHQSPHPTPISLRSLEAWRIRTRRPRLSRRTGRIVARRDNCIPTLHLLLLPMLPSLWGRAAIGTSLLPRLLVTPLMPHKPGMNRLAEVATTVDGCVPRQRVDRGPHIRTHPRSLPPPVQVTCRAVEPPSAI
ncbi:hypothetical protein CLOM_g10790 [Closterium sp. NIES-68]|nr:hypothetical protein CLOM_g10790 [Closterium sp. NIES-68]GJP80633.1 hypothetical protein CLOP_g10834 [Closterium sp. NIES-67]